MTLIQQFSPGAFEGRFDLIKNVNAGTGLASFNQLQVPPAYFKPLGELILGKAIGHPNAIDIVAEGPGIHATLGCLPLNRLGA